MVDEDRLTLGFLLFNDIAARDRAAGRASLDNALDGKRKLMRSGLLYRLLLDRDERRDRVVDQVEDRGAAG